jgi:hypothetical protein
MNNVRKQNKMFRNKILFRYLKYGFIRFCMRRSQGNKLPYKFHTSTSEVYFFKIQTIIFASDIQVQLYTL